MLRTRHSLPPAPKSRFQAGATPSALSRSPKANALKKNRRRLYLAVLRTRHSLPPALLRAVLGLRPRNGSRVAGMQASTRVCLHTRNTLALALTNAPCPTRTGRLAAPQPLRGSGYRPALYLRGFCLGLLAECSALNIPNFPMARQIRCRRAGVSGTSPALLHRLLALTDAPCFFITSAAACSRPSGSAPTWRRPAGPSLPPSSAPVGPPSPLSGAPPRYAGERLCPFLSAGAVSVS